MTSKHGVRVCRASEIEGLPTAEGVMRPLLFTEHVALIHLEIPPGTEVAPHGHPKDGHLYCIRGEIEVSCGEERFNLTAQNALFVPANVACGVRNASGDSVECLLISAPPTYPSAQEFISVVKSHSR